MICHYLFLLLLNIINFKGSLQIPASISNLFKEADTCECGQTGDLIAPRIVGGEVVKANIYPWMVGIFANNRMHCGGSLINDRYILTAGHCLNWNTKEELTVILGMHDRVQMETDNTGGVTAEIEKIFVHEDFTSDYLHDTDDVGLIKLKEPVTFTKHINPVCLPKPDTDYARKIAMVTGWGRTTQGGNPSRLLRKAKVKVMTNEECKNITSVGEHIQSNMLCAYEFEIDACQGDSGGPLVFETTKGNYEQIGVVSWGIGCAKPGVPGVYARITTYLEWLGLHTRDAMYCKNPVWNS